MNEFKKFWVDCASVIKKGKDFVVVQPTGSGKSMCFILPALIFPGKVLLVIEPVIAVIINQIDALQKSTCIRECCRKFPGISKNFLIII